MDLVSRTSRRTRRTSGPVVASKMRHPHDLIFGEQQELFMASELASELYVDEVLTGDGSLITLDSPGSVRGLDRTGPDLRPISEILTSSVARILYGW